MKKAYLATVIAMVITTSIASHVLAVGALGPAAPGFLAGLRSGAGGLFGQPPGFGLDPVTGQKKKGLTVWMIGSLTMSLSREPK